ncbi:hypothetical protein A3Q56_04847 [Intoshia linei]|uniref:Transcription factor AP-2 C-terminal domain-containing protein n=1 Tax=Intoshia linei TaxID=1819745 RepID=A0A177B110_9BILA|nr:hypothetical protein A3Q56_04847 [Intoshia linei]
MKRYKQLSNMNDVTKKSKDESKNYQSSSKYLKNQYANYSDYKFSNSESIERFNETSLQNSNYSSPFGYPIDSRNAFKPDLEIPQYFNHSQLSININHKYQNHPFSQFNSNTVNSYINGNVPFSNQVPNCFQKLNLNGQNEYSQLSSNLPSDLNLINKYESNQFSQFNSNDYISGNNPETNQVSNSSLKPNANNQNILIPFGGLDRISQIHSDNSNQKYHWNYAKTNGVLTKKNSKSHCLILNEKISPNDTFSTVPGRMSLLSSTSKYKVNVGEIQRRLSHPECLNASLLGGVLRRAKSKNGGKFLRKELDNIGLSIAAGRRKVAPVTLFTSLVEGEALRLARDWTYLNDSSFPCKILAQNKVKPYSSIEDKISLKTKIINIQKYLQEMMNNLKECSNVCTSNPTTQNILMDYNILTHGFGSPAIMSVLSILDRHCAEITKLCEKKATSENDTSITVNNQNHSCSSFSKSL